MRTVFKRYETTIALPIEYGAVMAVNAMSGLIFYKESKYMETWQIILMSLGIFIIVIGIMVGLRENQMQQLVEPSTEFQEKDQTQTLEPIQEKNEPDVSLPQSKQAVVDYSFARTSTAGFSHTDTYYDDDDEEFKISRSHRNISVTSIGSACTSKTRQSLLKITSEHGFDLPICRGLEVAS